MDSKIIITKIGAFHFLNGEKDFIEKSINDRIKTKTLQNRMFFYYDSRCFCVDVTDWYRENGEDIVACLISVSKYADK